MRIERCPSTLKEGFTSYSPAAKRLLFNNKNVSHILPFDPPEISEEVRLKFSKNRERISISGVQNKLSLVLDGSELRLSEENEHGQYILKPIPEDNSLRKPEFIPANEHLTMQIASQIFNINTAPNAMIFFKGGQPAYITKRFDIKPDNSKYGMEDFASLTQKTKQNAGVDFKYEGSYEEMFAVLKERTGVFKITNQNLYKLMLVNYLFSNGDAHLKNYSLLESPDGDYLLSPAYDLLNTRIHLPNNESSDLAMKDGMFTNGYYTESFMAVGYVAYDDFFELGIKAEIDEKQVRKILAEIQNMKADVMSLVERSFLSDDMKHDYAHLYNERLTRMKFSYTGKM